MSLELFTWIKLCWSTSLCLVRVFSECCNLSFLHKVEHFVTLNAQQSRMLVKLNCPTVLHLSKKNLFWWQNWVCSSYWLFSWFNTVFIWKTVCTEKCWFAKNQNTCGNVLIFLLFLTWIKSFFWKFTWFSLRKLVNIIPRSLIICSARDVND